MCLQAFVCRNRLAGKSLQQATCSEPLLQMQTWVRTARSIVTVALPYRQQRKAGSFVDHKQACMPSYQPVQPYLYLYTGETCRRASEDLLMLKAFQAVVHHAMFNEVIRLSLSLTFERVKNVTKLAL